MSASTPVVPGRVYISYRRDDTDFPAAWLYERLSSHLGREQVFKDVDSIELGDDFVEMITSAVGSCDVLLALIGDRWLEVTSDTGQRRLDDPHDFVRLELEAALKRKVRVIPILLGAASMPTADQLPASLSKLTRRQALQLTTARFEADIGRLLRVLDRTLAEQQAQRDAKFQAPVQRGAEAKSQQQAGARAAEAVADREAEAVAAREAEARAVREAEAAREAEAVAAREAEARRKAAAVPVVPAPEPEAQAARGGRWNLRLPRLPRRRPRPAPLAPPGEPMRYGGRPEPKDGISFTAGYPGVVTPQIWYGVDPVWWTPKMRALPSRWESDATPQTVLPAGVQG